MYVDKRRAAHCGHVCCFDAVQLDKVVYVVEQRLPVTMEESDTEDDDEDDEDGDDETDDSVVTEEEVGYEQQV